ncbi:MAG: sigma-70 family RNA polymerase sigma factor [Alicyclobacillus macrosporangiidus]|uniref:RNA polymerase sigma factor n=1 Tax=Alicyclobacillus macrosporangiidus TaxID=392015 RepID=UPI0026F2DCF6|nr:sigma-70 family RNA polymerase sigma factor [Alicyclobacillus macrosporangiidus]MCL6601074.1 sigma-70 family RNA polymerase sigma factor [Alicyclobacillus macrosporangiidus]
MEQRKDWLAEVLAAQQGDALAMAELVAEFSNVVLAAARRYRGVWYEDAVQEGYIALIAAVYAYDPGRSVPFPAFLQAKVWGDVRTAMRREWVRQARWVYDGGVPDDDGWDAVWDRAHARGDDGAGPLRFTALAGGRAGMPDTVLDAEWRILFVQAGLSPRERIGVEALVEGWTLPELAARFGVDRETCKTWRKRGLRKLRAALREPD